MSREDDRGIELEENILEMRIKAARNKPLDTKNPSGECWNCFSSTGHERRFCDRECADEWEAEQ